jgi:hypothetical protein
MQPAAIHPLDFVWTIVSPSPGRAFRRLVCSVCIEACLVPKGQGHDVTIASGIVAPVCECCKRRGCPTPPKGGPTLN